MHFDCPLNLLTTRNEECTRFPLVAIYCAIYSANLPIITHFIQGAENKSARIEIAKTFQLTFTLYTERQPAKLTRFVQTVSLNRFAHFTQLLCLFCLTTLRHLFIRWLLLFGFFFRDIKRTYYTETILCIKSKVTC